MSTFPEQTLLELEAKVELVCSTDSDKYNEIQKAEIIETLGIAQFYSGKYPECLQTFHDALKARKSIPKSDIGLDRSTPRIHMLVRSCLLYIA